MRYLFIFLIVFLSFPLVAKQKPQLTEYAKRINELVYQLSCDASDKKAAKNLQKTYSEALSAYRNEVVRVKSSGESLPWTKTYDLLDAMNRLSEEIMYNSAANHIICEPEFFDLELDEARANAVHELYNAGTNALNQGGIKQSRYAWQCFSKAGKIVPKFRDTEQKLQMAYEKATSRILFDQVTAYGNGKSLNCTRISETLLSVLQMKYLKDQFVQFNTSNELVTRKLQPTWKIELSFVDLGSESSAPIGNIQVVYVNGVAELKIIDTNTEKQMFYKRIPNQYVWKNYSGREYWDSQTLFDAFSLNMVDQIQETISDFINQSLN